MRRWNTVLFDLDGTLTDPKEGITKSAAYALRHFGIDADPDGLTAFIGPPLNDSFSKYFGLDAEQCVEAVRQYRVRFSDVGWAENIPYPGVREMLDTLRACGMTLLVATSKPEMFARRILAHFGLIDCFRDVCGITMSERETMTKTDVIRLCLDRNGIDPSDGSCVMVGDRLHDVEGGHNVGLPVVGVLYGYGSRKELEAAGADYITADMKQLKKILTENKESTAMSNLTREQQIAADLLKIKAVFFRPEQPFTWASGIKSPVYCDNRLTLTAPEVRADVEHGLAELIKENYPDAEVLMGTSTAGIAHAAIVGWLLDKPMGYVRSGSKDHGRQNQIEGRLEPGQKVVVVEDLISTGGSVLEVVDVLRAAGAEVLGVVSIFTYGMKKGLERLAADNVKNVSLTNFDVIADVAAKTGYIKEEDVARLIAFRNNPSDESWIGGAQ